MIVVIAAVVAVVAVLVATVVVAATGDELRQHLLFHSPAEKSKSLVYGLRQ